MGRWRESGRHPERQKTDMQVHTHIHTQITLAGVSPAVPSNFQGTLCCASVSGLKMSWGLAPAPPLIRTRVPMAV